MVAVAWTLVNHPASGFVLPAVELAVSGAPNARIVPWDASSAFARPIPDPVGVELWQARQRALLELSIARNFGLLGSMF